MSRQATVGRKTRTKATSKATAPRKTSTKTESGIKRRPPCSSKTVPSSAKLSPPTSPPPTSPPPTSPPPTSPPPRSLVGGAIEADERISLFVYSYEQKANYLTEKTAIYI
mmetsp:Transcript_13794/g.44993  ORF Transcript_13794/g.44993 Transcript_13794/m.44993 type:complete len:110 (-) Transcript_13794:331-660(-)